MFLTGQPSRIPTDMSKMDAKLGAGTSPLDAEISPGKTPNAYQARLSPVRYRLFFPTEFPTDFRLIFWSILTQDLSFLNLHINQGNWEFNSNVLAMSYMSMADAKVALTDSDRPYRFYISEDVGSTHPRWMHPNIGAALRKDVAGFKWKWLRKWQGLNTLKPKEADSEWRATMMVGEKGSLAPLHFDKDDTFLAQAVGTKCAIVVPKSDESWRALRAFPFTHPMVRRSQLATSPRWSPDLQRFDGSLPGWEGMPTDTQLAVIPPGAVLYNPAAWWHEIASVDDAHHANANEQSPLSVSFRFYEIPEGCENHEFCSKNEKFCIYTRNFVLKMMNSAGLLPGVNTQQSSVRRWFIHG